MHHCLVWHINVGGGEASEANIERSGGANEANIVFHEVLLNYCSSGALIRFQICTVTISTYSNSLEMFRIRSIDARIIVGHACSHCSTDI